MQANVKGSIALLWVALVLVLYPAALYAATEHQKENPFYFHEAIGAIYFHHDGSTVLYSVGRDGPPRPGSDVQKTGLHVILDSIAPYLPSLPSGLVGYPEPLGKILLFSHNAERFFLVGDSWLSDENTTVTIDQQHFRRITDLRRKGAPPAGALRWKKRWQEEITEMLTREKWLDEWERDRTGITKNLPFATNTKPENITAIDTRENPAIDQPEISPDADQPLPLEVTATRNPPIPASMIKPTRSHVYEDETTLPTTPTPSSRASTEPVIDDKLTLSPGTFSLLLISMLAVIALIYRRL